MILNCRMDLFRSPYQTHLGYGTMVLTQIITCAPAKAEAVPFIDHMLQPTLVHVSELEGIQRG